MDGKFFFKSKRVQGAALAAFGLLFPTLFAKLGEQGALEVIGYALDVAGALWHLYGQYTKGSKPLRLRPRAKK